MSSFNLQRPDALKGVERTYRQLIEAWNRRDAAGMAALMNHDGLMIGFDGSQMVGRDDVRVTLDGIFRDHATQPYVVKVRSVKMISFHTGVVYAIAGMIPPGGDDLVPQLNAVQCAVIASESEHWQIQLFQNTPAQYHGRPELAEAHTDELRQVLGKA